MYRNLKGSTNRRIIEEISLADIKNGVTDLGNKIKTGAQNVGANIASGAQNVGANIVSGANTAYNAVAGKFGKKPAGLMTRIPVKKTLGALGAAGGLYGAKKLYDGYEDGSLDDTMDNAQDAYDGIAG